MQRTPSASPFVKICGLRTVPDVRAAVQAGADAVGFVFAASPRQVSVELARELAQAAGPQVLRVGVFAGQPVAEVLQVVRRSVLDAVQLHGLYAPEDFAAIAAKVPHELIRAVPFTAPDLRVGAYGEARLLVDAPQAGAGAAWDYPRCRVLAGRWILAGGLRVESVRAALRSSGAAGVDVSSGVESARGVKDPLLIRAFVAAARAGAAVRG